MDEYDLPEDLGYGSYDDDYDYSYEENRDDYLKWIDENY